MEKPACVQSLRGERVCHSLGRMCQKGEWHCMGPDTVPGVFMDGQKARTAG